MANRGRSTSRPSRLATRSFGSGFFVPGYFKKRPASAGLFFGRKVAGKKKTCIRRFSLRSASAGNYLFLFYCVV